MAKKKMYTFSERRHSRKGITSTVLGAFLWSFLSR